MRINFFTCNTKADLYYVSIISDRFLVRSLIIHHVLQPNGNRNVAGSIRPRFLFPFGATRWENKDCLHRFILNVKTWSRWNLWKNILKLQSIVKKCGLEKTKTKNIPADWGKLKYQEKVGLTMKSRYYWKPLKTWKLKKITRRLQDFIPDQL